MKYETFKQIFNLGQIIGEANKMMSDIQDGYEMDCEISAEFTPAPNYDHVWVAACEAHGVNPVVAGVEYLRSGVRCQSTYWIHCMVPDESFDLFNSESNQPLTFHNFNQ